MSLNQKATLYGEKLKSKIIVWYKEQPKKRKRTIRFIPKVIVYMFFCVYMSGFIQTWADLIFFAIGAVVLGLFILFAPFHKLLS